MFGANPFGWTYFGQSYPQQGTTLGPPFIASVTAVYTPTVRFVGEVDAPFIASLTSVYTPTVTILASVRVSQAAIEALEGGASKARISQLAVEVAKQRPTATSAGLSQLATEVVYRIPVETKVVLSQLVVEVLVPPAPFAHTRFWAQIL